MTSPRPDQHHRGSAGSLAGSRSGSGDLAAALGYPGSPAAVQNCQTFSTLRRGVSGSPFTLGTFSAAGRIWTVVLSFSARTDSAFAPGTAGVYASVLTNIGGLTLATVNLGISAPSQVANGQSEPPIPGIPVRLGESVLLDVNNAVTVPDLLLLTSAVVFYSIP